MSVIPITLVISLCLVLTFVVLFLRQHARSKLSSPERDAMLPFSDDPPSQAKAPELVIDFKNRKPTTRHEPKHQDGGCSNKADHERCPDCQNRKKA